MNHEKLTSTHKRLTLLFTWVVFCIVLILWFSVLTAKYYNELRIAKRDFQWTTNNITNLIETDGDFVGRFLQRQGSERRRNVGDVRRDFRDSLTLSTSFFIINDLSEVVFQNINESPSFAELRLKNKWKPYIDDNTLVRIIPLKTSSLGSEVVFFKSLRYGTEDLFQELAYLFLMNVIFSLLFYFIGYRFVERALKPVEENLQDMSDFIHNAGHELKTPLAVMRGNMQVMQAEKEYDPKLIKKNIGQIDQVNSLIEWLRELSEVGKTTDLQNLHFRKELEAVIHSLSPEFEKKNITINYAISDSFRLYTNKQELHILLSNLIKNSAKYNKNEGVIDIILKKNILSIRDTGIGVSEGDKQKIFERFYQWSKARSNEWSGIGLSLVKKIVDANGWKIELKSELKKWTEFQIIF